MATTRKTVAAGGKHVSINELVTHFRGKREDLRRQWIQKMAVKGFLEGLTPDEADAESIIIYDTCINCLETDNYEPVQEYARRKAERGILRGMTPEQFLRGMLTLRDVYSRSLFERYQKNKSQLEEALDLYEPVANKILSIVALSFIEQRESIVRQQQDAIRELSTPVLLLRPGLLMLPIIGVLDSMRARQLTEQLLHTIRSNRSRIVVIDITGVAAVDSKVANHLLQTVDACRLMGAKVVVTGLSPEVAQTLVTLGVDLSKMTCLSDLQSGIDEADRLLGYRVVSASGEVVAGVRN